ncbi:MAG: HAD hydrolase family protein, partial [Acidobacteriaceae bacterium]
MSLEREREADERAKRIKVILFDVDGVLTDGTIWLQPKPDASADLRLSHEVGSALPASDKVEAKGFHAHDGIGVSLAKLAGLKVGFITKRSSETVAMRARDLRLDFCYQGQSNKVLALEAICREAGVDASEVCYVGDDIVDLPVLRRVGLAVSVPNGRQIMKDEVHYVTE